MEKKNLNMYYADFRVYVNARNIRTAVNFFRKYMRWDTTYRILKIAKVEDNGKS